MQLVSGSGSGSTNFSHVSAVSWNTTRSGTTGVSGALKVTLPYFPTHGMLAKSAATGQYLATASNVLVLRVYEPGTTSTLYKICLKAPVASSYALSTANSVVEFKPASPFSLDTSFAFNYGTNQLLTTSQCPTGW